MQRFRLSSRQQPHPQRLSEDPKLPLALRQRDTLFHAGMSRTLVDLRQRCGRRRAADDGDAAESRRALTVKLQAPRAGHMVGTVLQRSASAGVPPTIVLWPTLAPLSRCAIGSNRLRSNRFASHVLRSCVRNRSADRSRGASGQLGAVRNRSGALLDMTARFAAAPIGSWRKLSIPLTCLTDQGRICHTSPCRLPSPRRQFRSQLLRSQDRHASGKPVCK